MNYTAGRAYSVAVSPSPAKRSCTDVLWVPVFLGALGLLGCTVSYARQHGDLNRLCALSDFEGNLCGTGGRGGLAYFCGAQVPGMLSLHRRVCVDACPTGNGTSVACSHHFGGALQEVQDYPSRSFAGLLCMPSDPEFLRSLVARHPTVQRVYLEHVVNWSVVPRAWPLLLLAAMLALALSFAYLSVLQLCAECILRLGFVAVALVPAAAGFVMLASGLHGGAAGEGGGGLGSLPVAEPAGTGVGASASARAAAAAAAAAKYFGTGVPSSGDWRADLLLGVCGILLSLYLCALACHWGTRLSGAIDCVEKASECISRFPSLLLHPFLSLLGKAAVVAPLAAGFLLLLSCTVDQAPAGAAAESYAAAAGQALGPDVLVYAYLAYYALMAVWLLELCGAVSQFVIAYNVEGWYFAGRQEVTAFSGLAHGLCVGLLYHLGTLVLGSLVIPLARPARPLVPGLRHVHRNAYMDVALGSTGFCEGAEQAQQLTSDAEAATAVNGATWLFAVVGLGGVATAGAGLAWLVARSWYVFSDPSSSRYVEDATYPCAASALLSLLVAWPFMSTFDTVADTILYCEAVEAKQAAAEEEGEDESERPRCCGLFCRAPGADAGGGQRASYVVLPQQEPLYR